MCLSVRKALKRKLIDWSHILIHYGRGRIHLPAWACFLHPRIFIRGSVHRSVHHNFMTVSENQPFSINRSQVEHVMNHIIMQSHHQAKGRIVGRMGFVSHDEAILWEGMGVHRSVHQSFRGYVMLSLFGVLGAGTRSWLEKVIKFEWWWWLLAVWCGQEQQRVSVSMSMSVSN